MARPKKTAFLGNLAEQKCPVCYEPITGPIQTACGHVFFLECARTWFDSSSTCPSCRAVLYDSDDEEDEEEDRAEDARPFADSGPGEDPESSESEEQDRDTDEEGDVGGDNRVDTALQRDDTARLHAPNNIFSGIESLNLNDSAIVPAATTHLDSGLYQAPLAAFPGLQLSTIAASTVSPAEKRQSFLSHWTASPRVHGRYPRNSLAYIPVIVKSVEPPSRTTRFQGLELTQLPHYPVNRISDLSVTEFVAMLRSVDMIDGTEDYLILNGRIVRDQQSFEGVVQEALAMPGHGVGLNLKRGVRANRAST